MKGALSRWALATALALPLGVASYWAVVAATPYAVLLRLRSRGRAAPNTPHHSQRITASDRLVPLPNPDFVYTLVGYDIDDGPVRIRGELPAGTYASVSVYAANSVNVFVASDRELGPGPFDIVLYSEGKAAPAVPGARTVPVPTSLGAVLVRFLVLDDESYAPVRALQERITVERARD